MKKEQTKSASGTAASNKKARKALTESKKESKKNAAAPAAAKAPSSVNSANTIVSSSTSEIRIGSIEHSVSEEIKAVAPSRHTGTSHREKANDHNELFVHGGGDSSSNSCLNITSVDEEDNGSTITISNEKINADRSVNSRRGQTRPCKLDLVNIDDDDEEEEMEQQQNETAKHQSNNNTLTNCSSFDVPRFLQEASLLHYTNYQTHFCHGLQQREMYLQHMSADAPSDCTCGADTSISAPHNSTLPTHSPAEEQPRRQGINNNIDNHANNNENNSIEKNGSFYLDKNATSIFQAKQQNEFFERPTTATVAKSKMAATASLSGPSATTTTAASSKIVRGIDLLVCFQQLISSCYEIEDDRAERQTELEDRLLMTSLRQHNKLSNLLADNSSNNRIINAEPRSGKDGEEKVDGEKRNSPLNGIHTTVDYDEVCNQSLHVQKDNFKINNNINDNSDDVPVNTLKEQIGHFYLQCYKKKSEGRQFQKEGQDRRRRLELPLLAEDAFRFSRQLLLFDEERKRNSASTSKHRNQLFYNQFPLPLFRASSFFEETLRVLRWLRTWDHQELGSAQAPESNTKTSKNRKKRERRTTKRARGEDGEDGGRQEAAPAQTMEPPLQPQQAQIKNEVVANVGVKKTILDIEMASPAAASAACNANNNITTNNNNVADKKKMFFNFFGAAQKREMACDEQKKIEIEIEDATQNEEAPSVKEQEREAESKTAAKIEISDSLITNTNTTSSVIIEESKNDPSSPNSPTSIRPSAGENAQNNSNSLGRLFFAEFKSNWMAALKGKFEHLHLFSSLQSINNNNNNNNSNSNKLNADIAGCDGDKKNNSIEGANAKRGDNTESAETSKLVRSLPFYKEMQKEHAKEQKQFQSYLSVINKSSTFSSDNHSMNINGSVFQLRSSRLAKIEAEKRIAEIKVQKEREKQKGYFLSSSISDSHRIGNTNNINNGLNINKSSYYNKKHKNNDCFTSYNELCNEQFLVRLHRNMNNNGNNEENGGEVNKDGEDSCSTIDSFSSTTTTTSTSTSASTSASTSCSESGTDSVFSCSSDASDNDNNNSSSSSSCVACSEEEKDVVCVENGPSNEKRIKQKREQEERRRRKRRTQKEGSARKRRHLKQKQQQQQQKQTRCQTSSAKEKKKRRDHSEEDEDDEDGKNNNVTNILVVGGGTGVGKTASVYLAASLMDYTIIEMNTSKKRSMKNIELVLAELTRSYRLSSGSGNGTAGTSSSSNVNNNNNNNNRVSIEEELSRLKKEQEELVLRQQREEEEAARKKKEERKKVFQNFFKQKHQEQEKQHELSEIEVDEEVVTVKHRNCNGNEKNNNNINIKNTEGDVITIDDNAFPSQRRNGTQATTAINNNNNSGNNKKTIILFEDTDIVFSDENARSFYNAVRELAVKSKVPIIATTTNPHPCFGGAGGGDRYDVLPCPGSVRSGGSNDDILESWVRATEASEEEENVLSQHRSDATLYHHIPSLHYKQEEEENKYFSSFFNAANINNNNNNTNKGETYTKVNITANTISHFLGKKTPFTKIMKNTKPVLFMQLLTILLTEFGLLFFDNDNTNTNEKKDSVKNENLALNKNDLFNKIVSKLQREVFGNDSQHVVGQSKTGYNTTGNEHEDENKNNNNDNDNEATLYHYNVCAATHTDIRSWLNRLKIIILEIQLEEDAEERQREATKKNEADGNVKSDTENNKKTIASVYEWELLFSRFRAVLEENEVAAFQNISRNSTFSNNNTMSYDEDVLKELETLDIPHFDHFKRNDNNNNNNNINTNAKRKRNGKKSNYNMVETEDEAVHKRKKTEVNEIEKDNNNNDDNNNNINTSFLSLFNRTDRSTNVNNYNNNNNNNSFLTPPKDIQDDKKEYMFAHADRISAMNHILPFGVLQQYYFYHHSASAVLHNDNYCFNNNVFNNFAHPLTFAAASFWAPPPPSACSSHDSHNTTSGGGGGASGNENSKNDEHSAANYPNYSGGSAQQPRIIEKDNIDHFSRSSCISVFKQYFWKKTRKVEAVKQLIANNNYQCFEETIGFPSLLK